MGKLTALPLFHDDFFIGNRLGMPETRIFFQKPLRVAIGLQIGQNDHLAAGSKVHELFQDVLNVFFIDHGPVMGPDHRIFQPQFRKLGNHLFQVIRQVHWRFAVDHHHPGTQRKLRPIKDIHRRKRFLVK
ncbi:hypothetical protein SDC9_193736 [bioreactor metagenome]|uniref:Uncharacterized protein n=1 Tax=bioreactor metagenome TaxID=1076179 RepID=A0A645IFK5_9ZZZZ